MMIRSFTIGLALALGLTFGAKAQDCCHGGDCDGAAPQQAAAPATAGGTGTPVARAPGDGDNEDEATVLHELEDRLNEVLVVTDGRVTMREEFKASLPFPPERVE